MSFAARATALKSTGWAISYAYNTGSFSVASQTTNPKGIFLKPDGTKLYVCDTASISYVYEYNLSVPGDITSCTFVQSGLITDPVQSIFFKPDGTSLYVVVSGSYLYRYTLSVAWDITTITYNSSFSITQDTLPGQLYISSSGTMLFIVGDQNDKIYKYTLGTAWDTSSASFDSDVSIAGVTTNPRGMFISTDGKQVFLVQAAGFTGTPPARIRQLTMSTAWDLGSLTVSTNTPVLNFSTYDTSPSNLYVTDLGSNMYVNGTQNDKVFQFSI